jgi:hypothetical protein
MVLHRTFAAYLGSHIDVVWQAFPFVNRGLSSFDYQMSQLQTPHLPAESKGIFFQTTLIEKLD